MEKKSQSQEKRKVLLALQELKLKGGAHWKTSE